MWWWTGSAVTAGHGRATAQVGPVRVAVLNRFTGAAGSAYRDSVPIGQPGQETDMTWHTPFHLRRLASRGGVAMCRAARPGGLRGSEADDERGRRHG